ncbi:Hint domain-containing protein [Jannaschia sp. S6380]|uniref:Hint domain-containing protein n=1 Tax=Jannaschia sp. S6380 TaxID=2926408 RepID=UPI001FF3FA9E|nr:Hint domain-containing protein [Jannaschia sp. S6380]MCK0166797.1 Hint domain-containing protein [Jannaschia sp. S6380]
MPYTIYTLGESDVAVSGGAQLSGVTQGDGSHLVGETLTLANRDFGAVEVDDNDASFGDSDASQTLDGAQTIDGVTYPDGTRVEAEYALIVEDPDGNEYTLIGFNVNNSSPAYGTVEGLAVLGPAGGFPPAGVPLTVTQAIEGPNFAASSYATPICFAAGTLIATPSGAIPVEMLSPGDMVTTLGQGPQPLRWTARRTVPALGDHAPIVFAPGTFGNARPLLVSPQHRIWVSDWRAQVLQGAEAVLIPARDFARAGQARIRSGGTVTYHHLLFDRHNVILSEGVPTESFQPGATSLPTLTGSARQSLLDRCPRLRHDPMAYGPAAASDLRGRAARGFLAR